MLELVYSQQAGKRNFVPLGDADLMRLTRRSQHQISYDRRALAELVAMGMLRKVRGRGSIANGYSLREPRLWDSRRIRWLGPRERIISFFWTLQPRDLIDLSRDGAGHALFFRATGLHRFEVSPREEAGHDDSIAQRDRAASESHRAEKSAIDAQQRGPDRAERFSESSAANTVPIASKEAFKDLDEEEQRRCTKEAEAIGKRVAMAVGFKSKKLWGAALDPVVDVVVEYRDHIEDLYTLAVTVPPVYLNPVKAGEGFAELAHEAAAAGWPHPHAARIAGLETQIRTLENYASDSEQLPELYAELRALRMGVAS